MKLRYGVISNVDYSKGLAKVKFEEDGIVSGWLSLVVPGSKDTKFSFPLAINEQVAVAMDEHLDRGVILGAFYHRGKQPAITGGKFGVEFPGGNRVEFDPGSNKLTIVASGDVEITGDVKITGDLTTTGKVEANGEVTAKKTSTNVSLSTHIHPHPQGPTGAPTPGT